MKTLLLIALASLPLIAQNPLTQAVTARYESSKRNLIESGEVMPEADYGFKLTAPQRTFGGWLEHTAMGNYSFCAAIKGEAAPDTKHLYGLSAKAGIQKALKDRSTTATRP